MTLVVEDGTGNYLANSYAGLSYAQFYLSQRNKSIAWDAASIVAREAALIASTDYIDKRFASRFTGFKEFQSIQLPGSNFLHFISLPLVDDTLTIGSVTYTFVVLSASSTQITIGLTIALTITNLITAIASHPNVRAKVVGSNSMSVTNLLSGTQPEVLTSSSAVSRFSWDYASLFGSSDSIEQPLEWPRMWVYTRLGNDVTGIPEKLRQATVEYASRALSSGLMPDPVTNETGQDIRRKFEKVGPIEEETVYSSQVREVLKKFPEVDRLLTEFLSGLGGVIR